MKRIFALLITIVMLFSMFGCSKGSINDNKGNESPKDVITVTDMMGRKVEIPADTKSNTVGSTYGVATPFLATLNLSDRVLAANFKNKGFFRLAESPVVEAESIGTTITLDSEALASVNPSIYICKISDGEKIDIATKLNIPALTLSAESPEEVIEAYKMLGTAFGCEQRANEIISYLQNELNEIDSLAKGIKEDQKVTAICLGSEFGKVAGDDMLQTAMLKRVGAKTVVKGIIGKEERYWADCGVEKVFELNPEYIFVTSSSVLDYKLDDFYTDKTWSGMTAVKNKNVYQIPAKLDSWDMPGPGFILSMYYMMHCMYPGVVSTDLLQQKVDNYYKFLYGKTFTGEEIGYSF